MYWGSSRLSEKRTSIRYRFNMDISGCFFSANRRMTSSVSPPSASRMMHVLNGLLLAVDGVTHQHVVLKRLDSLDAILTDSLGGDLFSVDEFGGCG